MARIPPGYAAFRCGEYFAAFQGGRYIESGQHWLIFPVTHVRLNDTGDALVVGAPGVEGPAAPSRSERN